MLFVGVVYLTTSIKDCEFCAAACSKALGYVVVVVGGDVHLVTGLTKGHKEVSAPVFWMNDLTVRGGI